MLYNEVLENFYEKNINYLIVGGLAVNIHGVPRLTHDLDIIILLEKENIIKICDSLKKLGYIPRLPVNPENIGDPAILKEWTTEKNMKAFSFYKKDDSSRVVDIVLFYPLEYSKAFEKREEITIKNMKIKVISLDDLIEMKKYSARDKDLSDVKMLIEVKEIENKF